jgi:hypothetical protein
MEGRSEISLKEGILSHNVTSSVTMQICLLPTWHLNVDCKFVNLPEWHFGVDRENLLIARMAFRRGL